MNYNESEVLLKKTFDMRSIISTGNKVDKVTDNARLFGIS